MFKVQNIIPLLQFEWQGYQVACWYWTSARQLFITRLCWRFI